MIQRIIEIRKHYGLNQEQFAKKLNLSRSFINQIEVGKRNVSDRTIADICREFHVSEEWLRTGAGEMVVERSRSDELSMFMDRLLQSEPDDIRRRFVSALSRLSTSELEVLEKAALLLAGEAVPDQPDISAKVEELERQNQELTARMAAMEEEDAKAEAAAELSAWPSVSAGSLSPVEKAKK